jgi:hypothetical protein
VTPLLAALLLAAAAPQGPAAQVSLPPTAPTPAASAHGGETKCAACHTPEGWGDVKFIHERTGFPLTGRHAKVACRQCHVGDFKEPLARTCAGCHRDVHGGYSGVHCASCHDTENWKSLFDADAHRRTNFPLQGRHAILPCEQCHGDRRDRSFARPTVSCWECHQADVAQASASGVDHSAYAQTPCLGCHGFWRWSPANFSGHGACFPIASGPHAVKCMQCHITLPNPLVIGSCNSVPYPDCVRCHQEQCANHPPVSRPVCNNENCYGCHYNGTAGGTALPTHLQRTAPAPKRVKP